MGSLDQGARIVTVPANADEVVFDPTGSIAATDVQAAIEELLSEDAAAHIADASGAHAASAISVADTAEQLTATDVEAALAEILDAHQAHLAETDGAHAHSAVGFTTAAGDTLGNLVGKVEIFDAAGVSAGFLPVYDAITTA